MSLDFQTPMEYRYIYWTIAAIIALVVTYYVIARYVNQKRMVKSLAKQKGNISPTAPDPDFKKSKFTPKSRIYVAQADRDLDPAQREEFDEFGPLITIVESKKVKHITGGIFLLGFTAIMAYSFFSDYRKAIPVEGSDPTYILIFTSVVIAVFIYYGLLNLHHSTYSVRLYKKGLVVRSFLKTYAYYYDNITEIKTYEYRRKGLFPGNRSFIMGIRPTWVCELNFSDNNILYLDTSRYHPELYDKMTRWEKNLTWS